MPETQSPSPWHPAFGDRVRIPRGVWRDGEGVVIEVGRDDKTMKVALTTGLILDLSRDYLERIVPPSLVTTPAGDGLVEPPSDDVYTGKHSWADVMYGRDVGGYVTRLEARNAALEAEVARLTGERDEAVAWIGEATKTLTGLAGGGSENFVRKGECYRADLPFCERRIRERLETPMRVMARWKEQREAALSRAESAEAEVARLTRSPTCPHHPGEPAHPDCDDACHHVCLGEVVARAERAEAALRRCEVMDQGCGGRLRPEEVVEQIKMVVRDTLAALSRPSKED